MFATWHGANEWVRSAYIKHTHAPRLGPAAAGPLYGCTAGEDTATLLILAPGAKCRAVDYLKLAKALQVRPKIYHLLGAVDRCFMLRDYLLLCPGSTDNSSIECCSVVL